MFFNDPFATSLPSLLDGSKTASQINDALNDTLAILIHPEYLQNPTASKYAFLNDAYKENSPTDWIPKAPVFMYHGDADITVPYQNSVGAYDGLIKAGASSELVTLTRIDGGNHSSSFSPYLVSMVKRLMDMESN